MRKAKETIIIQNLTVEKMAAEGKCIARHEGKVVFIEGVAPGDVVDVQVKRKKNSFIEASPIAFHQYSDLRKEPICSHFGVCGGCKWQHIGMKPSWI